MPHPHDNDPPVTPTAIPVDELIKAPGSYTSPINHNGRNGPPAPPLTDVSGASRETMLNAAGIPHSFERQLLAEPAEPRRLRPPHVDIVKYFSPPVTANDNERGIVSVFRKVCNEIENRAQDGPEKTAGYRKLLEAFDCFMRCAI